MIFILFHIEEDVFGATKIMCKAVKFENLGLLLFSTILLYAHFHRKVSMEFPYGQRRLKEPKTGKTPRAYYVIFDGENKTWWRESP